MDKSLLAEYEPTRPDDLSLECGGRKRRCLPDAESDRFEETAFYGTERTKPLDKLIVR